MAVGSKQGEVLRTADVSPEELEALWGRLGESTTETRIRSNGTIVPLGHERPGLLDAVRQRLPAIALAGACEGPPELALGHVLGEGAMGIVRAARQVPVDREVAVKSVRPEAVANHGHTELLCEAWITGRLEHPNIVPIYAIGRDGKDLPLLVMKRIEGDTWNEVLQDPEHKAMRHSGRQPEEWHIAKLIQVCNAIAFAHSKGIIHRDLKPENVMIGAFGEVYVLDWGIAVSVRDDPTLPLARDVETIAGTPDYMAPEMTIGEGALLGYHTDIYLLGAVLYEILAGHPPHVGETIFDKILEASQAYEVELPDTVPEQLARICRRAMAYEPEDRFQTVGELREALGDYLSHRSSVQLAAEALGRLQAMRYLLEEGELEPDEQRQLQNLFGEARFGFKVALRSWPDNAKARQGYQETLELMIDHELNRGAVSAAGSLLTELPEERRGLATRLEELEVRKREEGRKIQRLERIEQNIAGSHGTGAPAFLMGFVLVAWGLTHVVSLVLTRNNAYDVGSWELTIAGGIILGVSALAGLVFHRRLLQNRSARRLTAAAAVLASALAAHWAGVLLLGSPWDPAVIQALTLTWAILGAAALAADPRLMGPALVLLAAHAAALAVPAHAEEIFAGATFVAAATMSVLWRPQFTLEDPEVMHLDQ